MSCYPEECCGILIGEVPGEQEGNNLYVSQARKVPNLWEGKARTHRFLADPSALFQAEKEYRGKPEGIVGIYHSHPDVPANPSIFDLERAWPFYSYLILSVYEGKLKEARAWRLAKDLRRFRELKLKTVQESCMLKIRSSAVPVGG